MLYTLSSPLGVEDLEPTGIIDDFDQIDNRVFWLLNHGAEYVDVSIVDCDNSVWSERRVPGFISDNGSVWSYSVLETWRV